MTAPVSRGGNAVPSVPGAAMALGGVSSYDVIGLRRQDITAGNTDGDATRYYNQTLYDVIEVSWQLRMLNMPHSAALMDQDGRNGRL